MSQVIPPKIGIVLAGEVVARQNCHVYHINTRSWVYHITVSGSNLHIVPI